MGISGFVEVSWACLLQPSTGGVYEFGQGLAIFRESRRANREARANSLPSDGVLLGYSSGDPIRNRLRGRPVRLVEDDDKFVIGIPEENIGAA